MAITSGPYEFTVWSGDESYTFDAANFKFESGSNTWIYPDPNNPNTSSPPPITVSPTVYPSNPPSVEQLIYQPINDSELREMLNHCFVCGVDEVLIVCDLCKEAMLEVRKMMVRQMMKEMEEMDELPPGDL